VKRGVVLYNQKSNGTKSKPGFTIASPNDEDEDEWVSSESGAATPSHRESDLDDGSDDNPSLEGLSRQVAVGRSVHPSAQVEPPSLSRVDTARPSDYGSAATRHERHVTHTPVPPPIIMDMANTPARFLHFQMQESHHSDSYPNSARPASPARRSPHPSHKLRPPSTHSVGRGEQPLRPHPLIRGHSYGQAQPLKPAPLAPLTVITDSGTSPALRTEPSDQTVSTSPASTASASPTLLNRASLSQRRPSVSSARSVATLPSHSNIREPANWTIGDRKRTLSTISHSSSSAALSSLVRLPTVTRPPSPQAVSFFPPVNPHANVDGIHPLLPGPYLNNHLTVLVRRNPINESFDRVTRARQVRA